MKSIQSTIKGIVLGALATTLAVSCKKEFLEITPKGRLVAEKTSDYNLLLNNLDLVNHSTANGGAQTPLGDEMAAMEPYFTGSSLRIQRFQV